MMFRVCFICSLLLISITCMGYDQRDQSFELSVLSTYPSAGLEGKYFFTDNFGLGLSSTLSWDDPLDFQVAIRPVVIFDLFNIKDTQFYLSTGLSTAGGMIQEDGKRAFNIATYLPIGIGVTEPTKAISAELMIAPGYHIKPTKRADIRGGIVFSFRFGAPRSNCSLRQLNFNQMVQRQKLQKRAATDLKTGKVKKGEQKSVAFERPLTDPEMIKWIHLHLAKLKSSIRNPLKSRVTSRFGMRHHPILKKPTFHQGIDIAAKRGTPIKAAHGGVVTFSGKRGSYGNVVFIKDGVYETRYAHCYKLKVKKGDKVKAGTVIGTVGSTGRSTGPHLHFEIRLDSLAVNPELVLKWE